MCHEDWYSQQDCHNCFVGRFQLTGPDQHGRDGRSHEGIGLWERPRWSCSVVVVVVAGSNRIHARLADLVSQALVGGA